MTRGRPRSSQVDEKIAIAALEALDDHGFAGMTIDGVAKRAGVSKATIYRRFDGKADLITAAIAAQRMDDGVPPTGTTREQLVALLEAARKRMIDNGHIGTLLQILAEAERNPELLELHRERTISARRATAVAIMEAGVASGEIRADADFDLVFELFAGAWMAHYALAARQPADTAREWAERVVALIWPAIAAPE